VINTSLDTSSILGETEVGDAKKKKNDKPLTVSTINTLTDEDAGLTRWTSILVKRKKEENDDLVEILVEEGREDTVAIVVEEGNEGMGNLMVEEKEEIVQIIVEEEMVLFIPKTESYNEP
jgi:hypothetical protein